MQEEYWEKDWEPVIARIGQVVDMLGQPAGIQPDAVEAGAIRKYLEPLEFDCALHYDADVARQCGYTDVIAPYTSCLSFALLPMWLPGKTLFNSDDRNAQPEHTAVKPSLPAFFPPIKGYFATDVDLEFVRPAVPGDILRMEPGRLLSCEPKQTSVGRGAFIKSETRIVNQAGDVLAWLRSGSYLYNPYEAGPE